MISRRKFLGHVPRALVAGSALHPLLARAFEDDLVPLPDKQGMIERSLRFLDLETPAEYLNSWITPVSHFFVRNHMYEPGSVNATTWSLKISGEVERPLSLTMHDLSRLGRHAVTNTLECAGNGRGLYQPRVPGIQWERGGVGNARFSGPRLRDVLERAGIKSTAKHVVFRGMDGVPGKVPPFVRSIPIEKALDRDTLIATQMNDAVLSKHHGFPARALVPGWIGAASIKWLSEITLSENEFDGNFMKPGYRLPNKPVQPGEAVNVNQTHSITELGVKSIITSPGEGEKVGAKPVVIRGAAWAGEADIIRVEVSIDGGTSWQQARLDGTRARYSWRLWSHAWKPRNSGEHVLMSRAFDSKGRVQPLAPSWNPSGYLYNAADKVNIYVQT
ncbi:MAG TPA: sulfite oxidase [Terriglobales bacterium]|nr:sulfite oxidase [Terriglobales bacterium]